MRKAILAGIVIMLGCGLNLTLGGIQGAFMFSIGLMIVVQYRLNLFTGKVGLLAVGQIKLIDLLVFFVGNLIGVYLTGFVLPLNNLYDAAQVIIQTRIANGVVVNFLRGVGCGLLVTAGVASQTDRPALTILSVMAFILLGFNHCIADLGYFFIGGAPVSTFLTIIPTLLGNSIGGVLFIYLKQEIGGAHLKRHRSSDQSL